MQADEIVEAMKVEDEIDNRIDGHKKETADAVCQKEDAYLNSIFRKKERKMLFVKKKTPCCNLNNCKSNWIL